MLRRMESMSFVRIHDQLRLDALSTQRVPELEALRSRTLAVAISHNNQRWRLHVLDVFDRRTLRIHRSVVVYRLAEERHHPLIDRVLSVITLPVADTSARDRRLEPCRPRHTKHGHEPAITPARQSLAILVDREALLQHVHPSQNVSQVAIAKVLDIRLGKLLSLSIAPAWIRHKHKVPKRRERHSAISHTRPAWRHRTRRPAMDAHHQRILL